MSSFELVFVRRAPDITKLQNFKERILQNHLKNIIYYSKKESKLIDALYLDWKTVEALSTQSKNQNYKDLELFDTNDLVYLLAPHASSLVNWHIPHFTRILLVPLSLTRGLTQPITCCVTS